MSRSQLCAIYSGIGVLFMLWVGIMIKMQPFYISGLKDVEKCKDNAFGAMGLFIFTFLASLVLMVIDGRQGNNADGGDDHVSQGYEPIRSRPPPPTVYRDYDIDSNEPESLQRGTFS